MKALGFLLLGIRAGRRFLFLFFVGCAMRGNYIRGGEEAREQTYTEPPINTSVTPTFSLRESFKRHTIGSGKTKIKRSEMKFKEP